MDLVLEIADTYALDKVWATLWPALPRSVAHNASALASLADASATSSANLTSLLGLSTEAATWAASASSSALSPSHWFENTVLKQAVSSSLSGNKVNWSALGHVSALPRDNLVRQTISLHVLTYLGILVLYFTFAGLSYKYIFNKEMQKHPRYLKNQVRLEIESSMRAFLPLVVMTVPWFVLEVRGHSKLYNNISDHGWEYAVLSVPLFLVFTDFLIYWVHRIEHHPRLYKHIHKPHHKWIVPTPFASHAFHPLDGYVQSLPYHVFPFVFPLHRVVSICLFVFVNLWSILIHDSDMICDSVLEKLINGPSHHTLHHMFFTCNYGQYFTLCDRAGGSYRAPRREDDPLLAVNAAELKKAANKKAAAKAAHVASSESDASSSGDEGVVIKKLSRKNK
ncbi:putative sterol delta 5,6-desaturase [Mycosarcoma maydis]|uniref:Sterol delta 5,6-desaturase n=1 Tax=Mycosarcoma maydis TaxID=5270 RepID=A0A0D1C4C9_MYCMD|nr:putative sterol delta 5,6-desaturase [Ustilago maydis 521]KIS68507.1 putative sterol delta 5,6-desaturase [Ustilago maydis 521]|eukprot:XP_011390019.1 putative sterol delta 5,6-desaturase [Ustilago maydis 521]